MSDLIQFKAVQEVIHERYRQDAKWGSQRQLPHEMWVTILSEEVGEAAKEVLEHEDIKLKDEVIQCAAVCLAWLEALIAKENMASSSTG